MIEIKMNSETEQIFIVNTNQSQPSASTQKLVGVEIASTPQDNLETVEDFSNVCRTCATITEFVIPIFAGEGLQNNLADKIHKHLPIQVCESDVLPRVVCYQCASTLLAWHELVQCCVQADAALRARIASQQEPKSTNQKSNSSIEEETQSKLIVLSGYTQQPPSPPQYPAPPRPAPPHPPAPCGPAQLACAYCSTSHDHDDYKEHLVTAHADMLFHCEECDKYIDRKDFIHHMSLHAVQYTSGQDKKDIRRKKVRKKKEDMDVNQNTECTVIAAETVAVVTIQQDNKETQENEFSDHSDMEYGFGPLPESVFEAIEDSQDSQPIEEDTRHSPENERLSEESNKSVQPIDNSNLSNPVPSIENSNLSSCALPPIETNDFSNCALSGVATSDVSNCAIPVDSNINNINDRALDNNDLSKCDSPDISIRNTRKKPRTCPICSKVYTAASSYFYHMKYFHKGTKEHECHVCGREFGTKACLTEHVSIHTGERQLECKECKKRFRSKASLYIHEQTHNGVKTLSCTQCHRSFRWRTQLLKHMKRHTAEKAHVCETCGRGFNIRCDLIRHARTHTAGNFTCEKCGLKLAQLRYLKVHMEKKHSTNIVTEAK